MDDDDDIDEEYEGLLLAQIEEKDLANKSSTRGHRGSVIGLRIVNRDPIEAHERLYHDYFANPPKYGARLFQRRFRMKQALFMRIHDVVVAHDTYFVQRRNVVGRLGLSSLQKVTAAFRMLAYGVPADYVDEYVQIRESTAIESLKRFVTAVVEVFGDEYLRSPNSDDLARLLTISEQRGFPGMLGNIDLKKKKNANLGDRESEGGGRRRRREREGGGRREETGRGREGGGRREEAETGEGGRREETGRGRGRTEEAETGRRREGGGRRRRRRRPGEGKEADEAEEEARVFLLSSAS
ncbi:hypothetical protein ACLB2K_045224 [Fragaria x ananassa]